MSLAAFIGGNETRDYINANKFGLKLPKGFKSYIVLADVIQTTHTELLTRPSLKASNYLKVISLGYQVFGPRMANFTNHSQADVGSFTLRFIEETRALVFQGKPRDFDIRSWDALLDGPDLSLSLVNVVKARDASPAKVIDFGKPYVSGEPQSIARSARDGDDYEYLCKWMRTPDGLSDLMYTLQHCYGKHSLAMQDIAVV